MWCKNCPPSHAITPYPLQTACGSLPVSYFRPLQLNVLDPVAAAPCGGCMLPVFRAASTSKPSPCALPAPCCIAARSRLERYRRSRGSLSASRRPARAWTPPLMNLGRCPSADLAPCVYHVHSLRRSSHVKKGVRYPVHTRIPIVTPQSRKNPMFDGYRLEYACGHRCHVTGVRIRSTRHLAAQHNIQPRVHISLSNLISPRGSHGALIDNTRWRSP
jgi:hypothetical protein